jgi:hypothetical protein
VCFDRSRLNTAKVGFGPFYQTKHTPHNTHRRQLVATPTEAIISKADAATPGLHYDLNCGIHARTGAPTLNRIFSLRACTGRGLVRSTCLRKLQHLSKPAM